MAASLAVSIAAAVYFYRTDAGATAIGSALAVGTLCALGLLDCLTARVTLHPDAIETVANFRKARVARADVAGVDSAKGVGVALKLKSGGWFRLPQIVYGPHANTVRAWLRRG